MTETPPAGAEGEGNGLQQEQRRSAYRDHRVRGGRWWETGGPPPRLGRAARCGGPKVTSALLPRAGPSWASPPARPWCSCSPGRATRSTCAPSTWGAPAREASPPRSTPQVRAPDAALSGAHGATLWQARCSYDVVGEQCSQTGRPGREGAQGRSEPCDRLSQTAGAGGPELHSSLPGQALGLRVLLHAPPTGGLVTSHPTQPGRHPWRRLCEIPGRAIAGARVRVPAMGPAPGHPQARLRPATRLLQLSLALPRPLPTCHQHVIMLSHSTSKC